jgi:hypothetical protein
MPPSALASTAKSVTKSISDPKLNCQRFPFGGGVGMIYIVAGKRRVPYFRRHHTEYDCHNSVTYRFTKRPPEKIAFYLGPPEI